MPLLPSPPSPLPIPLFYHHLLFLPPPPLCMHAWAWPGTIIVHAYTLFAACTALFAALHRHLPASTSRHLCVTCGLLCFPLGLDGVGQCNYPTILFSYLPFCSPALPLPCLLFLLSPFTILVEKQWHGDSGQTLPDSLRSDLVDFETGGHGKTFYEKARRHDFDNNLLPVCMCVSWFMCMHYSNPTEKAARKDNKKNKAMTNKHATHFLHNMHT